MNHPPEQYLNEDLYNRLVERLSKGSINDLVLVEELRQATGASALKRRAEKCDLAAPEPWNGLNVPQAVVRAFLGVSQTSTALTAGEFIRDSLAAALNELNATPPKYLPPLVDHFPYITADKMARFDLPEEPNGTAFWGTGENRGHWVEFGGGEEGKDYFFRPRLLLEEFGAMGDKDGATDAEFDIWVGIGLERGWAGPAVCSTHDGIPATEAEELEFEEGSDPCIPVMRLYESKNVQAAVEANHSPSNWRKPR